MARGLHRYADMKLRYGSYGTVSLAVRYLFHKKITSTSSVSIPRGDFRIFVFGGGGGGAFYISNPTATNGTGVFSGNYGVACGGRGGIVVFDIHSPQNGTVAACTIGAGGTGKTASSTTAAGTGGQTKIVISSLGITVSANGGAGGKAGASLANCVAGAGGTVSVYGVTPVLQVSKAVADAKTAKLYASKLDYGGYSAVACIMASQLDEYDLGMQLKGVLPRGVGQYVAGDGGNGEVSVAYNSTTDKYKLSGYDLGDEWASCGATMDGNDGMVIIERL